MDHISEQFTTAGVAPVPYDESVQRRRFRLLLQCGIGIMLLFCVLSFLALLDGASQVEALSAATDGIFTAMLVGSLVLLRRIRIPAAALSFSVAIMIYGILNLLLFPTALLRVISLPTLAVIITVAYVDGRRLRALSIAAWLVTILLYWLGNRTLVAAEPIIDFGGLCAGSALILLALNQFHARINETLAQTRAANAALRAAQAGLEIQVTERTASLQEAMHELRERADTQARLLAETEQQRATIRALGVPVLPVNRTTLAVPLVGIFDTERLRELQAQTLHAVAETRAKYLVIDITGVPAVDRKVAEGLMRVAQAVGLMGARVVLAGIRPEVAQVIVSLGLDLGKLQTAATLQEGLAVALRYQKQIGQ